MLAYYINISFFLAFAMGAMHPAKRQAGLTFQDLCGKTGVDCKNGYCCYGGQKCTDDKPPMCRDLLLSGWSMEAIAYTSLASLLDFNQLTTIGLTLSTIPRTLTISTALPTYTDNPVPSQYTPPPIQSVATTTSRSPGPTAVPAVRMEVLLPGVFGVAMGLI